MTTHVAREHGGDGRERPPHSGARKIAMGCESCKLHEILKYIGYIFKVINL